MDTVQQEFDEFGAGPRLWDGFLAEDLPPLAPEELHPFTNKRIFITGAGGYLGSALAQSLATLPIAGLVLLDQAEYGLYRLGQSFASASQKPPASLMVGNILDRGLLQEIFRQHAPEVVFHAAAMKHVPLMETNPFAAAETNVLGTQAVLEMASSSGVSRLIFLSTDKAVDPISVMGASKRVAEQMILRANAKSPGRFAALRLCNVLGSTGSVAPLFARQAAAGLPLTLTHPDTTRFFVSTTDAVRCLLRAAITPSETGLFIPRLQHAYKILELAQFILQRCGVPAAQIVEMGLRGGDKLHEQLVSASERMQPSKDPSLLAVSSSFGAAKLPAALESIRKAVRLRKLAELLEAFHSVVPSCCDRTSDDHPFNEAVA